MIKRIREYWKQIEATERAVWLLALFGLVFVVVLALRTEINIKFEIGTNEVIIDTSYYNIKDHVEVLEPSKNLYDYLQTDTVLFGSSYSLEQQIYFMDNFVGQMEGGVDKNIKHKTNFYFIHCTATPQGRDIDADWLVNFFHRPQPYGRGWARVGYSACITEDGTLDTLSEFNLDGYTSIDEFTYGVRGVNMQSLNFALVGGVDENLNPEMNYTPEQIVRLTRLIDEIICSDPEAIIIGHRDHEGVKKACPSFDVRELYNLY